MAELRIMTLNLQYFASYPKDEGAARKRLLQALGGEGAPDVICVQEGLASRDVLKEVGFVLVACSGAQGVAQAVKEMVYNDEAALNQCDQALHSEILCNQIYINRNSTWELLESGVKQISSPDVQLVGGNTRARGQLALRSLTWAKVQKEGFPSVYTMCTHISGGRFEDQYFVQQLAEERFNQLDRIMNLFESRQDPAEDDLAILAGDFNATITYLPGGPMSSYFKSAIANSAGVEADVAAVEAEGMKIDREERFKRYMISPFKAIEQHGWSLAYGPEVGCTSAFGHLIDHMAMSRNLPGVSAKVVHFTNQKFGGKPPDTDLPLTDHNAVSAVFTLSASGPSAMRASVISEEPASVDELFVANALQSQPQSLGVPRTPETNTCYVDAHSPASCEIPATKRRRIWKVTS